MSSLLAVFAMLSSIVVAFTSTRSIRIDELFFKFGSTVLLPVTISLFFAFILVMGISILKKKKNSLHLRTKNQTKE